MKVGTIIVPKKGINLEEKIKFWSYNSKQAILNSKGIGKIIVSEDSNIFSNYEIKFIKGNYLVRITLGNIELIFEPVDLSHKMIKVLYG